MQRTIEIYARDVYRAKTENMLRPGIFFEEVYKRTDEVVCDIIEQMESYSEDSKKYGYKAKYHGMGNNIVVFCADRGQGKTTALQSYAAYLQKKSSVNEQFFTDNSAIDRAYFQVLDPIDPSSLDNGESIIRVLVSRLFLGFSKIVENNELPHKDEINFRREKDKILEAFQKCYENIDYLQRGRDVETYDLETLAQLGNSAELKENLHALVNYFLDVVPCEEDKKPSYLVVQIDDADLSMGDIFKICDDIRNYFSIPNIIVMMAINYSQLELAICQRYMKQYKHIIKLQGQAGFEEECNRMAFRYLEKMLPVGHRVVLPSVDIVMNENADFLTLLYYRCSYDKVRKKESCIEVFGEEIDCCSGNAKCKNMQQQLIKMLYIKTGIVLFEHSGEIHPMLPHTLRELAHFMKLLDDMEAIDQRKAFSALQNNAGSVEIENWKRNLDLLMRYFLNDWCGTHLSYKQQKLMEEIDSSNRKMAAVCQSIEKYMGSRKETDEIDRNTYRYVMKVLVEEGLREEPILQNAVFFYYTIVLNKWFVQAAENPCQFRRIAEFVGEVLEVNMKSVAGKEWNIFRFEFSGEKLREYAHDELENTQNYTWISLFCTEISDTNEKPVEKKMLISTEKTEFRFDLFRPILAMLYSETELTKGVEKESELKESADSDSDEAKNDNGQYINVDVSYLISAKNVISNYDVQSWLRGKIQRKIDEWTKGNEKRIDKVWEEFYKIIDSWVVNESYLTEKSTLENMCFGENLGNAAMGDIVFLCNDERREWYAKEYKEYLAAMINTALARAGRIMNSDEQGAAEVAVKQMIGEIKSDFDRRKIILSMEDKKTGGQLLQRIPELDKLITIKQQFEEECNILAEIKKEGVEAESMNKRINVFLNNVKSLKNRLKK